MIPSSKFRSFLLCALVMAGASAVAETQITVSSGGVTATGVTPRAEVVFFGRSVTQIGGVPWLERHAFVERDDDGDGVIVRVFEEMPQYSVWAAIDSATGAFATGASEGLRPKVITLSPQEWRRDDDAVDLVRRSYLDFLLVRPGRGAWMLAVFQGGMRDGDGRSDNNLQLRTSEMQPLLGTAAAPVRAVPKDVLVIIDPRSLDIAVVAAE